MTNDQQLAHIEQQIKDAESDMEMVKSLENLKHNPDFKKVILEGYLKTEAVRLVHLKADANMSKPEDQARVIRDIDGIGTLAQYFNVIAFMGRQAERSIAAAEEARDEILAEGEAE